MCITFIFNANDPNGKYRLIILNNRDELIDRATGELDWRDGVLGGIDEQDPAKGTWLCINKHGKIGNLLSITQPVATKLADAPSRGNIPSTFVKSNASAKVYCDELAKTCSQYNGYHFVALERDEQNLYNLFSFSNQFNEDECETVSWPRGTHVIGNSIMKKPYKKAIYGKMRFEKFIETVTDETSVQDIIDGLLDIATDRASNFPDAQYSTQTERSEDFCLPLSSIFVRYPETTGFRYGTRSHSIIIVDKDDHVHYFEKRIADKPKDIENALWSTKEVSFKITE